MTISTPSIEPFARRVPTSSVLRDLLGNGSAEAMTLDGMMGTLGERSFGVVMLLFGLAGLTPGVSGIAGIALAILATQMMLGHSGPVLPGFVSARRLPVRSMTRVIDRTVPVLIWLEGGIRPRWHTPFHMTKRLVGIMVLLVGMTLLIPLPLSNLAPALVIMLIGYAYLEEDGVLLGVACAAALVMVALASMTVWGTIGFAHRMG